MVNNLDASDEFYIYRSVILKLDANSGEILWKTYTGYYLVGTGDEPQNNRLIIKVTVA